jgi:hypothetical protein
VKRSSRLLMGFGIGILVLVIVTVVLALSLGQKNTQPLAAGTPEGTVQRFLLAIQSREYLTAYSYLVPTPTPSDFKYQPRSIDDFTISAQNISGRSWKATLGKVNQDGNKATVNVSLEVFESGGPFGNPISNHEVVFFLEKTGDAWLISSPIDLYWLY